MIAACSSVGLLNEIPRVYRAHYWLNVEESKLGVPTGYPSNYLSPFDHVQKSNPEQPGSYSILVPGSERRARADQHRMRDGAQPADALGPAAIRAAPRLG